jgi:hypothetical protein
MMRVESTCIWYFVRGELTWSIHLPIRQVLLTLREQFDNPDFDADEDDWSTESPPVELDDGVLSDCSPEGDVDEGTTDNVTVNPKAAKAYRENRDAYNEQVQVRLKQLQERVVVDMSCDK